MFKVIHVTTKEEAFANAITVLCENDDNMSLNVTKLQKEKVKDLVKDQHVTVDIDIRRYRKEIRDLIVDQIGNDLGIPDLYNDELERDSDDSDLEYNFDDIILFVDVDYDKDEFVLTYYKVDILI